MKRLKFHLALAGILLAVVALWRDDRRITWVAIAVLGAALVLRIATRGRSAPEE